MFWVELHSEYSGILGLRPTVSAKCQLRNHLAMSKIVAEGVLTWLALLVLHFEGVDMTELLVDKEVSKEERDAERFEDVEDGQGEGASEQEFRDATLQLVVQRNDFLLPNLIDMLQTHKTLEVSPYYQRRARWDISRKSRLIESFLVNIPVPPVFLFENEFATYEVMDGQQRVSALLEYFTNQFPLRRLEILTSLIGKRFHELPTEIRAGLQRRSLSAIILLKESASSQETVNLLRRHVFQRLNTGGVRLNAQEIRNSVNAGQFNDLLLELSRHSLFTTMWGIPPLEPNESTRPSAKLLRSPLYRQMRDVELVLRVFGLLDPSKVSGGMRSTLDKAMERYSICSSAELSQLGGDFIRSLELAFAIGGEHAFRLPDAGTKRGRPSAPLFDGMMVALMRRLEQAEQIQTHSREIRSAIQEELNKTEFYELVVGRANTRSSTSERSRHFERLIASVIDG